MLDPLNGPAADCGRPTADLEGLRPAMQREPAIDEDHLAHDITRGVRGKEGNNQGDLIGVTGPPKWRHGAMDLGRIDLRREVHRRRRLTWSHAVDADAMAGELQRHHLCELPQATFRGAISGAALESFSLEDARNIHDRTAPALHDHAASDGLCADESTGQVGGDDFLPFGERQVEKVASVVDAGIVDEDINAAELLYEPIERGRDELGHPEVDLGRRCTRAEAVSLVDHGSGPVAPAMVGDADVVSVGGEAKRGGATNARATASDDRDRPHRAASSRTSYPASSRLPGPKYPKRVRVSTPSLLR